MILKQQWMGEWIISGKVKEDAEGVTNSHDMVFVFKTDIRSIMVLPVDLLSCKGVKGAAHPSVGWIGLEDRCAVHVHPLHDLECHHPSFKVQGCKTFCILASGMRENGERMRK